MIGFIDKTIIIPISSIYSMKVKPNLFSPYNNLDSILAAVAGFILIQIFSKHSGIGVSPDSVTYISAARHLTQGSGFVAFDNAPVTDFPFGYPFFLTILSFFTRLDPLKFGSILNGVLFALLLYLSGSIMNGFKNPSGWYKRIILACIILSPAMQEVYSLLWSETVFLPLILLFIVSITNYLGRPGLKWLWISAVVCAVACLTRYAGIFLVPAGLCLIFFNKENKWRQRIIHCIVFGSFSVSLLLINIIHNLSLTGLATGPREKSSAGILTILENFGAVISDWLLLDRVRAFAISASVIVVIFFTATVVITRQIGKIKYGLEYVTAVTGLAYCVFMLVSSLFTRYEQFTSRLLSPMFILLLWSVSWWIPEFIAGQSYRLKWLYGSAVLLITAWFMNTQLQSDFEYYDGVKDAGIPGYQEDPFVQSDIVQWIEKNKTVFDPRLPVFSNAGDAFYFITGFAARQVPFTVFPVKVKQYYLSNNNYLVWFRDLDNPDMPDLHDILENKNMAVLKEFPDGAVYVTR